MWNLRRKILMREVWKNIMHEALFGDFCRGRCGILKNILECDKYLTKCIGWAWSGGNCLRNVEGGCKYVKCVQCLGNVVTGKNVEHWNMSELGMRAPKMSWILWTFWSGNDLIRWSNVERWWKFIQMCQRDLWKWIMWKCGKSWNLGNS